MKKLLVFVVTLFISAFVLFYSGKTAREDFATATYIEKCNYALYGDSRYELPNTFEGNVKLGAIELFGEDYRNKAKEPDMNIDLPEIPTDEISNAIDSFGKRIGRTAREISK